MAQQGHSLKTRLKTALPPSAILVGNLAKKIDMLLMALKQTESTLPRHQVNRISSINTEFSDLELKYGFQNHEPTSDAWERTATDDRQKIRSTLQELFAELSALNSSVLKDGKQYFAIFIALFALLFGGYLWVHLLGQRGQVSSTVIIATASKLRTLDLEINELIKKKAANGTLTSGDLTNAVRAVKDLGTTASTLDLSTSTLQLIGNLEAEVSAGEITETETFAKVSKKVSAELESFRTPFLWSDRWGRWFEIAFWAELGTLVGIVFYIAGSLSQGRFLAEEKQMFWTEVFIAPIVVLAIFFLFDLTGITGISPQESSITGIAGFAFVFGFAIRRTIGLLDTVKKRIFPDPAPASTPEG